MEDPVFGTWYYLSLKKKFFEGSTRYQCSTKIFQNFFGPKLRYLNQDKSFFEFISWIFRGPCTGTKCEKVVLFRIQYRY
jgi:hypothetical protein